MAGRFIKLYDRILNWEWFGHPNTLCLFIYLLVKAYYKDTTVAGKTIRRGQLVTSLPKISTDTGLTIQQARTALAHLISTGEVTDESNPHYRIITVVKYNDYQSATDRSTDNQQTNNRQINRQSTDNLTPYIESIERIEDIEKIEKIESKGTAKRFTPPTKEEIFDFCLENKLSIDVDYLYDYYAAKGWKIGKDTMKDWKAAVRNWARREKKDQPSGQPVPVKRVTAQVYTQRDYSDEDNAAWKMMLEEITNDG